MHRRHVGNSVDPGVTPTTSPALGIAAMVDLTPSSNLCSDSHFTQSASAGAHQLKAELLLSRFFPSTWHGNVSQPTTLSLIA